MNALLRVLLMPCLIGAASFVRGDTVPDQADVATVRKHVAALRAPKTTKERLGETVAVLAAIKPEGASALDDYVTREVRRLTAVVDARPKTEQIDGEIDKLRETLLKLRKDADLSKEQLKEEGLPALESLTTAWSKRETALAPWRKQKQIALGQAERLSAVVSAWQAADSGAVVGDHVSAANKLMMNLALEDPEVAKVLAENERIASGLSADIVAGMTAVNAIRIPCGLHPRLFDPKLCEAAAMHSRDMETNDFFAHESPLPGKKKFTDRAKLAGTNASGENIHMGSAAPQGAIKGWFLSPGHHKNMLTTDFVRQGLGRSGTYWTQLFGR